MKIFPTTKLTVRWVITASVDLTGATARVLIDEVWYPLTWSNASTPSGVNWVRTCVGELGGLQSDADIKVGTKQEPMVEVTVDGQTLVGTSGMLQVI